MKSRLFYILKVTELHDDKTCCTYNRVTKMHSHNWNWHQYINKKNIGAFNVLVYDIHEKYTINSDILQWLCYFDKPFNPFCFDLFQFNSSTQFSSDSPGYVATPLLKDKIHIVVIVMDATSVDIFPQAIIDKIKTLQAKVYQKGMISVVFYIHDD